MFTGLIEEVGIVKNIVQKHGALQLTISASKVLSDLAVDDSISVDGVCLTVVKLTDASFEVEAVEETLKKTTIAKAHLGQKVNLERSLRPSDRMGGHFVQGHVDDVGRVANVRAQAGGKLLTLAIPERLMRYIISEGSIAINGVSLTVARLSGNGITISLIPHTLAQTTLGELRASDQVNIEVDLLGKYIEKLLPNSTEKKTVSEWLQNTG